MKKVGTRPTYRHVEYTTGFIKMQDVILIYQSQVNYKYTSSIKVSFIIRRISLMSEAGKHAGANMVMYFSLSYNETYRSRQV